MNFHRPKSQRLIAGWRKPAKRKTFGVNERGLPNYREPSPFDFYNRVGYWQVLILNDANRVCQLNVPFDAIYSFAYQNVQSSDGSSAMLL